MLEILQALSSLSPLAVIALLAVVIYQQVLNQKGQKQIATNHLHGLPEMQASLTRIEDLLRDIHDNTIYLRARINGGSRHP